MRWDSRRLGLMRQVVQEGVIPPLVAMLRAFEENLQMLAAACVRNIALDSANKVALAESGILPPLVGLISSTNVGVQEQVCWVPVRLSLRISYRGLFVSTKQFYSLLPTYFLVLLSSYQVESCSGLVCQT